LPEIVTAFDFAFGLRCRSIAQSDAIEMESSTELSESIRSVGEKERMIIYIECQRQAVESENPRQEVQVRQQSFGRIKTSSDVIAGGIIQYIQQNLFLWLAWQPTVRRGIILPERTQIPDLPAFESFGFSLVACVRSQLVLERPATDTGAVGFEIEWSPPETPGDQVSAHPTEQARRYSLNSS